MPVLMLGGTFPVKLPSDGANPLPVISFVFGSREILNLHFKDYDV
jgi:hypothetical protein